ncbi:hypothetical protein HOLleu_24484 [Holothuria leucospilota]|uniref:CCHC-type domain-containing protein n=1 Tax=Holothuria leucospilota TaxID=206669 RepID=A0A9Q1H3K5_HOLLE|nr:hypothetical protein HOLleu_24484 [Holothuria leucospilota]
MRPGTLEEALKVALDIETFYTAEKQRSYPGRRVVRAAEVEFKQSESVTKDPTGTATEEIRRCRQSMADLQSEIKAMRNELQLMKDERRQEEGTPIRFKCRKPGHMRRNCPEKRGNTTKQNEVSTRNDHV